jgi:hypothetical protein
MQRARNAHIEVEFLQRPVVGLGYVLPGGSDVGFGSEQAPQPDVHGLHKEENETEWLELCSHPPHIPTTLFSL